MLKTLLMHGFQIFGIKTTLTFIFIPFSVNFLKSPGHSWLTEKQDPKLEREELFAWPVDSSYKQRLDAVRERGLDFDGEILVGSGSDDRTTAGQTDSCLSTFVVNPKRPSDAQRGNVAFL